MSEILYADNIIITPNELRKTLELEPIKEPKTHTSTNNCPNCGAPITSWKCDYCDTVFERRTI